MIDLAECTRSLVTPGRGILAADESPATADKYLAKYDIEGGEEMRHTERMLFLETPCIEKYLSGVILHTETLEQKNDKGVPFPQSLWERGIVPGIKVDEGTEPMEGSTDELITKGLIGLPERLAKYRAEHHVGFTKWRAAIKIDGDRLPTSHAIVENAKRLALYAKYVQEAGMVAIVEPEVLYAGTHSRMRSLEVLKEVHGAVIHALTEHAVDLSGILVKTSMALSGSESGRMDSPEEVAEDTLAALTATIPADVLGIVFLSGGQTPEQATANLAAIHALAKKQNAPWPLTFSFARAIQEDALDAWHGKEENLEKAQTAFLARLKKVADAISV